MNRVDFICNIKRQEEIEESFIPMQRYVGIDWGVRGEDLTSICIITKDHNNKLHVEHRAIREPDFQMQIYNIRRIVDEVRAEQIVSDIGAGQVQCQMLQNEYGDRVKSCYYAANLKAKMSYKDDIWMLSVDRDAFLEESGRLVKKPLDNSERHSLNYAYIAYTVGLGIREY